MKILSVCIEQLKRFGLSGIRQLEFTATSPIQIFIGENGSGKSSLLEELHPCPAVKPAYGKNGIKQLTIEHEGDRYVITSDFGSTGGAHSFVKNDTELNISGTAGIQIELAEQHLGYTQLVHDILFSRIPMCQMSKVDRKQFLLAINPIDLSLVIERHKLISSKIREYKSQLILLHKKKQEIETKLINDGLLEELKQKQIALNKELTSITSELYHLEQIQAEINSKLQEFESISIEELKARFSQIKQECIRLLPTLERYKLVDRSKSEEELASIYRLHQQKTQILETQIQSQESQIQSVVQDLTRYKKYSDNLDSTVTTETIEQELKHLKSKKYDIDVSLPKIPSHEYEHHQLVFREWTTLLHRYLEIRKQWCIRPGVSNKIKYQLLPRYTQRVTGTQVELDKLEQKIKEDQATLQRALLVAPCSDILKESCEYYRSYHEKTHTVRENLKVYEQLKQTHTKKIERNTRVVDRLTVLLDSYEVLEELLIRMVDLLQSTVFRQSVTGLAKLLTIPSIPLTREFQQALLDAPKIYEQEKDQQKINELTTKLTSMIESKIPSVDFAKELITTKEQEKTVLEQELQLYLHKHLEHAKLYSIHEDYFALKSRIDKIQMALSEYNKLYILLHNQQFCTMLITDLKTRSNEVNKSLREIETTLTDQTGYKARLEDTVKTLIELDKRKSDLEIIEKALSPYSGFPYQHMVDYTNVLIKNVNYVLSQVWSYPLSLCPIDDNNPLDGTFKVDIDGIISPDISKLSKSQKTIINLAWTFAFIISKKLTNYPVFLDECDDGLNPFHKQKLLEWLKLVVEQGYVSQLWMVHHDAILYEGFTDAEVLCLKDDNTVKPEQVNSHATMS